MGSSGIAVIGARSATVGNSTVRRLLPARRRRTVGAWCFADHYGPDSVDGGLGMQVPPHPHIGLQTVTWLFAGRVLHNDSIDNEQVIEPGQLNLMTAGRGISHAERSPLDHGQWLHGLQLWVALPDRARWMAPAFEHYATLPVAGAGPFTVTVFAGSFGDLTSPATVHSELVGAQIDAPRGGAGSLLVQPDHEHALWVTDGQARLDGVALVSGRLVYLPPGRDRLALSTDHDTRFVLIGGKPSTEDILMWWNFVGRTPDELAAAATDWPTSDRFGTVFGDSFSGVPAPVFDPRRLVVPR